MSVLDTVFQPEQRLPITAPAAPAPSPFLSGTNIQFAWDSTSLGWLKECPRKYYYQKIRHLRSKGTSVHLTFGLLYHKALEDYDRLRAEGASHNDALHQVVLEALQGTWADGRPWASDHNLKTRETLIRSIIWYFEEFGENDNAKTLILANGKPAVELTFKMQMDWGPVGHTANYVLSGHLDRLVDFTGGIYVMDRKTSSSTLGSYYFDQYSPDNQMSLYTLAAKVIYQTPVRGVIIDAVQIAVGFSRYARGFTYRTDEQIDEWLADTKDWLFRAEQYATANLWPMNDKSCHNYGGCPFRKVCSKSPGVRENIIRSDFVEHEWNPLAVR